MEKKRLICILSLALLTVSWVGMAEEILENQKVSATDKLYEMSPSELLQADDSLLELEIQNLSNRNKNAQMELDNLKAYNSSMCLSLEKMKTRCVGFHYIGLTHGLENLSCSANGTEEVKVAVEVTVAGGQGKNYVLLADGMYVTQAFSDGKHMVEFQRIDVAPVVPPRFKDLVTLEIVAVKDNSVDNPVAIPSGLQVSLQVAGQDLMGEYPLEKDANTKFHTSYLINPKGLAALKRSPGCFLSYDDLNALRGGR